jgi:16S rRNA (guanine527-N7)-methyltransferase
LILEPGEDLRSLLKRYGIQTDSRAAELLARYYELLKKWNRRINLTASTDWNSLGPLFHEGIWASGLYPEWAECHLDIGSGAGFPALVIRIMVPQLRLEMVESRSKKAYFLQAVVDELGLSGTKIHAARLKDYLRSGAGRWDCVSWKGLKLVSEDILQLRDRAHAGTQLWLFHGRGLPVEDPETMAANFRVLRSERCPGKRDWMLTIYAPLERST